MATIVDVARRAGVSVSTVSHVVNRTRHVNADTARLVEEAIAFVRFRPNALARSLKRASTDSVGIAMSVISNPYFSDIVCAIEAECARLGLMVFLSDTQDDPAQELRVVQALHQRRVDGIILAASADPDCRAVNYLSDNRIPFVLVDRFVSPRFDQVGVQNKSAMQLLVAHLASHGHRRIGFIAGPSGFSTARERIEGYKAALKANGLAFDEALLAPGSASTESADRATRKLFALADPPTALAAGNNLTTIGAMHALRELGLRVPDDVALVGFDDFEWADYFEPRLTVIAQPCREIGREAASLLVKRIGAPEGDARTIRLKPKLVTRTSCGCGGLSHAKKAAASARPKVAP
jgi:LacI family transcriptional regulator, galactose operon repressor